MERVLAIGQFKIGRPDIAKMEEHKSILFALAELRSITMLLRFNAFDDLPG